MTTAITLSSTVRVAHDAAAKRPVDQTSIEGLKVRGIAARLQQTVKTEITQPMGYGNFWNQQAMRFGVDAAKHLVEVGLAIPPGVATAIAPERSHFLDVLRTGAFTGEGNWHFWNGRCKQVAAEAVEVMQFVSRRVDGLATSELASNKPNRAAIDARAETFAALARELALTGRGDADYWSTRTKQLAFETVAYAADIAALVGETASPKVRAALTAMLKTATDKTFDGHAGGLHWRNACRQLRATVVAQDAKLRAAIAA